MSIKPLITDFSKDELRVEVEGFGWKPYVADQIWQWLYVKAISSFGDMTNISKSMRLALDECFDLSAFEVEKSLAADDGTIKLLLRTRDDEHIESVIIPADDGRVTVCASTQIGCRMGCVFCRTAEMGFKRNLTSGEIIGQIIEASRLAKGRLTNVVLMGMGEPLDNIEEVSNAVEIITDSSSIGISKKKLTLSTSGLIPMLKEFVEKHDIKIAISLNAASNDVRSQIMPVNKKYSIGDITRFCRAYSKNFKNRITFEYVLIGGVNDDIKYADLLAKLLRGIRAKVNLIPFNSFAGCNFKPPARESVERWSRRLYDLGIQTNIRASRGREILAACGQLAANNDN